MLDGGLHHGEAYVVQHDMHVLARHRDALGHLSVDQGFEVAAIEHYTERLGIGGPALVDVVNQRPDQTHQLGVLRPMGLPHQEVPDPETGWPAA
jgi:hypothetical protein